MSKSGHRLVVGNRHGPITDWPEWLSLDVQVEFELDDTRRVSTPVPRYGMGGPLDCTRAEFEERVRGLLFSEPSGSPPPHPRMDPLDERLLWLHTSGATGESRALSRRSRPCL